MEKIKIDSLMTFLREVLKKKDIDLKKELNTMANDPLYRDCVFAFQKYYYDSTMYNLNSFGDTIIKYNEKYGKKIDFEYIKQQEYLKEQKVLKERLRVNS